MKEQKIPLTLAITPEARDLLEEWADSVVGQGDRKPLGFIVTELILECQESGRWADIERRLRDKYFEDVWRRREKRRRWDRNRKAKLRKQKPTKRR